MTSTYHQTGETWFSLMLSVKQKCSFRTRLKYVEYMQPLLWGRPSKRDATKGLGGGVGSKAYFSRPILLPRRPTTGSRTKDGRPAETFNTKVSGKVNLIFYKLNLFPIFLVDKVKKKKQTNKQKNRKIVICTIMKNFFTITAARATQCEFSINNANLSRILQF